MLKYECLDVKFHSSFSEERPISFILSRCLSKGFKKNDFLFSLEFETSEYFVKELSFEIVVYFKCINKRRRVDTEVRVVI